jgi:hypothetical protein
MAAIAVMRRRTASWLTGLVLILALLRNSNAESPALTPLHLEAIKQAAGYLVATPGADRTDHYIRQIAGADAYAVMQRTPGWALLSTTRRLDIATRAAELGHPAGGQQFLARLASALAKEFDTVEANQAIKQLRALCQETDVPLAFVSLVETIPPLPEGSPEAAAIRALHPYVNTNHVNIDAAVNKIVRDPMAAHLILVQSADAESALNRALQHVPPDLRRERLEDVVIWIADEFAPARRDAAFRPFLATATARHKRTIAPRPQQNHPSSDPAKAPVKRPDKPRPPPMTICPAP